MTEQYKLNYILVGLVVMGIITFLYLLVFLHAFKPEMLLNSFFWMGELGALLLYANFFLKNKSLQINCVILFLSLIVLFAFHFFYNATFWTYAVLMPFLLLLGCIHFTLYIVYISKNKAHAINNFCLFVSLPLFIMMSNYLLRLNGQTHPMVMDEFLMAMDGTLGIYPSLIVGRFIQHLSPVFSDILNLTYMSLPLAFILVYIKRESFDTKHHRNLVVEILLIGIVGFMLYNIIPGCGSLYAFNNTWPVGLPDLFLQEGPQLIYCPAIYPRNCLPSLHMAWLICLLRYVWLCDPITKVLMLVLALGNVIAMFGVGAHYLTDLIVGFAFANFIGGLSSFQLPLKNAARRQAVLIGGSICIAWYVMIIYGIPLLQTSKILAWFIFLSSIFVSVRLEWNLFKEYSRAISNDRMSSEVEVLASN